MKKVRNGVVNPLSRCDLKMLLKRYGLQLSMFDPNFVCFQWEGLEYEFYIIEDSIYLEKITVIRDVFIANLEKFKPEMWQAKHELPDFLK